MAIVQGPSLQSQIYRIGPCSVITSRGLEKISHSHKYVSDDGIKNKTLSHDELTSVILSYSKLFGMRKL